MKYQVTAPNGEFEGTIGGTRFVRGVAEVAGGHPALAYFRRRGYKVESTEQPKRTQQRTKKTDE